MAGFFQRLLKIEPGISLGQWAVDRIVNNWAALTAFFIGVGGMGYLTSITDALAAYAPIAFGGIGLFSALAVWAVLCWGQAQRAEARMRRE